MLKNLVEQTLSESVHENTGIPYKTVY